MNKVYNVGLVGCGHISETYFRAQEYFNNIKIIKCADLNNEAANKYQNAVQHFPKLFFKLSTPRPLVKKRLLTISNNC